MKTLTNKSLVKIKGRKGYFHFGFVGTIAAAYAESDYYRGKYPVCSDFVAEQARRGCGEVYGVQSAVVLVESPVARAEIKARQDASIELTDGEVVDVDGAAYVVKFNGDYSDFLRFERV